MNTMQYIGLVALLLAALAVLIWLGWRIGKLSDALSNAILQPLAEMERRIGESFGRANADMAARVEQIKGDLRADLTARLQDGLNGVRQTVDQQLAQGRAEQSRTVAALEQKFDALRATTEQKLESQALRQSEALRESRQEMTRALNELGQVQAQAAKESREELARGLNTATQQLAGRVEALEKRTIETLEQVRNRVDERLGEISRQVQEKLEKNIQEGFSHFQKVQEHLKAAEEQLRNVGMVGQSINELNNLLKLPHLRGKFGEAELSRLLSDFLPAAAYREQEPVVPGSREMVDAVVIFPKFKLPIDSKFNREQILPLFETSDPQQLAEARRQLADVIKQQARSISEKYIHPEHGTADLALMFLPSETIYFEVIRNTELCEALYKLKVFPVSPNTLAITLKSVAMSYGYYEFAKNVEKTIEQISKARISFEHFQKKFEEVGKGLEKAQEAYGTASGHLNRYANRVVALTGEASAEVSGPESQEPLLGMEKDE